MDIVLGNVERKEKFTESDIECIWKNKIRAGIKPELLADYSKMSHAELFSENGRQCKRIIDLNTEISKIHQKIRENTSNEINELKRKFVKLVCEFTDLIVENKAIFGDINKEFLARVRRI